MAGAAAGPVPRLVAVARDGDRGGTAVPPGHLARLKGVVRGELGLTADAVVLVSELRCGDRDCAPVETLVAVLVDGSRRVWRVPVPVAEVSPHMLRDVLTGSRDGGVK